MSLEIGVDEVGRGPWAGPLAAAAVALDPKCGLEGLKDSKLLGHQRRWELSLDIKQQAEAIGIGWAGVAEIDRLGLTKATRLAMLRALSGLDCSDAEIIVDGNFNYLKYRYRCQTVIKADCSVPAVSAASIIAKVARDHYMHQMAKLYPDYGFAEHVGYGTSAHQQCLKIRGPSDIHRRLFAPVAVLSV